MNMIFIAIKTVAVAGFNKHPWGESLKKILIVNVLTSTAIIVTGSVINYFIWKLKLNQVSVRTKNVFKKF